MATVPVPPRPILIALAKKWGARQPELASRLERALSLVGGLSYLGENIWSVVGSKGKVYYVEVDHENRCSSCTCEDSERGNHCKHRLAVALIYTGTRLSRLAPCRSV